MHAHTEKKAGQEKQESFALWDLHDPGLHAACTKNRLESKKGEHEF
jgi:hypothetical protein